MSAPLMAGSTDPRNDRRQRRLLVGLAALFFAPIALSFYLYYGHSTLKPVSHVNRGTLIVPPHTVPEGGLPLLRSGVPTDAAFLRQVRTALDRDMTRVQRVFVTSADCCDADWLEHEHPDLIAVLAAPADGRELTTPGSGAPLLTSLPTFDSIPAGRADRVYVIDPLGNLMMTYPSDFQPKGLLEDMHRLLKLSHIG